MKKQICTRCNLEKSLTQFRKTNSKTGYSKACLKCAPPCYCGECSNRYQEHEMYGKNTCKNCSKIVNKTHKTCTKCKIEQPLDNFVFNSYMRKDGTKGKSNHCKSCQKKFRQKNKEYWRVMNKKHSELRREKPQWEIALELGNKNCPKCNKIKPLDDFYNSKSTKIGKTGSCKSCINQQRRDWINTETGREKFNRYNTQYFRTRKKHDPEFKLSQNVRIAISNYAKTGYSGKNNKTWKMLDYTPKKLRIHLENQFTDKMNWDNYGSYWEIEHATPQSWFDLNDPEEIKKCWSLKNLYPATAEFNRLKGNRHNLREDQI